MQFRAVVSNAFGSATSNSATLTVLTNSSPTDLVYRFYHAATNHYFYTISEPERDAILGSLPAWTYQGPRFRAWHFNTTPPAFAGPLYRFFRQASTSHFFTVSTAERDNIINNLPGWNYEGEGFFVIPFNSTSIPTGAVPVYRYFNPPATAHFYTTDQAEAPPGFNLEGIAFYAYPTP